VIAVDETGEVRDGDALLYAWAVDLHRRGRLRPAAIVATTMSNLGLERALADQGIAVVRCDVGDRYVMETLRRDGLLLGGEQSGHLLRTDLSTTGDGLLTGLHVAAVVARSGRPASQSFAGFRRYPQRLHNVPVRDKKPFAELPHVAEAASDVERELAGDGRLVLRYSGTERLARIMIEAPDQATVDRLVERLAQAFAREAVSAASAEAAGAGGVRP
jgi:phosphoglucosamine mutase